MKIFREAKGIPEPVDTSLFSTSEKVAESVTFNEDNPRVKALAKKVRTSVDENGKPVSKMRMYQFRDGLFEAMLHRFKTDPTMAAWGRGKPRLGRRLRRLPWPDRGSALPSSVQLAHRRGLDRGCRRRLRDGRWPRGRRAHVLRLPGPLR